MDNLYINPKVARPDPLRSHSRPRLAAGDRLYVPACEIPPVAADGTRDVMTEEDWQELRDSVIGDAEAGCTWNLT